MSELSLLRAEVSTGLRDFTDADAGGPRGPVDDGDRSCASTT